MATNVTSANFDAEVTNSAVPVVIDVYATWCGPCKQMTPIIDELAKEMGDKYKILKLNIDEERDLAVQYNVSSVPTFVFIKEGKLVAKETGSMSKDGLLGKIQTHLGE